jgi:hypothetical protein
VRGIHGCPPRSAVSLAGPEIASPELSRTVIESSARSPRIRSIPPSYPGIARAPPTKEHKRRRQQPRATPQFRSSFEILHEGSPQTRRSLAPAPNHAKTCVMELRFRC